MLKPIMILFKRCSFLPLLLCVAAWSGCSKPKEDRSTGNLPTTLPLSPSTIRLVNLASFTDLTVNGQTLTNLKHAMSFGEVIQPSPTIYFPTTGKVGTTYYIPQQCLNSQGSTPVKLFSFPMPGGTVTSPLSDSFTVIENYTHPNDYYAVGYRDGSPASADAMYTDSVFVIPRTISPANDPTHIKIRLLNLSSAPDDASLTGPMSLTLADGTPVSTITSNVNSGSASDYIELPYGSYQFKVFTSQGAQVPGIDANALGGQSINRYTAVTPSTGLTFAPIQAFQPGGAYTIVVSVNNGFVYTSGNNGLNTAENSFHIITDISPAANLTYAHVQAVNTLQGNAITVLVDGKILASQLPYDSTADYQAFANGNHYIEVTDNNGSILAQQMFAWNGNDNYTIWAYSKTNGDVGLLFAQNNLSNNLPGTPSADGSDNSYSTLKETAPTWIRFLNFCPDLPLVTFTQGDGRLFNDYYGSVSGCTQNLALGQPATQPFQYITQDGGITSQIQVYQSQPLIVPGNWLSTIPALHYTDFIRSPFALYPNGLPLGEPGVYTVALTGRYNPNGQGQQAKMIIVKHTR